MMELYINGRETSYNEVEKLVGEKRLVQMIEEAKEQLMEDPMVENEFMIPGGMLTVRF